jgi:hypothetical protein
MDFKAACRKSPDLAARRIACRNSCWVKAEPTVNCAKCFIHFHKDFSTANGMNVCTGFGRQRTVFVGEQLQAIGGFHGIKNTCPAAYSRQLALLP